MLRILETELISDFADGFAGVEYFFFCDIDQFGLDMFGSGFPGLFFDQIAEIIGGQMHLICTVFYCRQARTLPFFGLEIVVQQIFEPGENVFVDIFAGDELTVVETDTIVEE